jgi:hypothetical protein
MHRLPIRGSSDLLAATEAIGKDQCVSRFLTNARQQRMFSNLDRNIVMSVLLHPLQDRHKSSDSLTCSSRQPPAITSPRIISKSKWARPRVLCISSRVARKLGHIMSRSIARLGAIIGPVRWASRPCPAAEGGGRSRVHCAYSHAVGSFGKTTRERDRLCALAHCESECADFDFRGQG